MNTANDIETALQGIKKSQIKRLGYVAGIKRMGGLVCHELRQAIQYQLENILHHAHLYREHARRKTLSTDDITHAIKSLGLKTIYGGTDITLVQCTTYESQLKKKTSEDTEDKKKVKFSRGIRYLRRVRYYQKQHDVVFFAQSPFQRLVRTIGDDFGLHGKLKYSKGSFVLLQLYIEDYLVDLLECVNLVCINAGRETIYPKDVHLVRRIRNERM